MPSPSTVFTQLVSTTLRNTGPEITDNVSLNNALLRKLKQRGNIKTLDGGTEIQEPLEYAENSTYTRYFGYDPYNINASDVITSAKYDWAQVAINVTSSGRELRINSGKERMFNLVKAKKKNAYNTANNQFSVDLYSDGSLTNQIGGLANLIQTNGQGTVGGIDSGTWTFWRNKFREITGSNAYTKDTILGEFNALWLSLVRGADMPDLIVLSHDFYSVFEASQQQYQRWVNRSSEATVGFTEGLAYKNAEVIFDNNTNFATNAEKGYFLNTKYLYLAQHRDAQWSADEDRKPTNQDAVIVPIYWMGNLITTNRALQGVLIDAT
jgi:hypothetical protein